MHLGHDHLPVSSLGLLGGGEGAQVRLGNDGADRSTVRGKSCGHGKKFLAKEIISLFLNINN